MVTSGERQVLMIMAMFSCQPDIPWFLGPRGGGSVATTVVHTM